jgi:hypothetical protein
MSNQKELAADTNNGVYVCENPEDAEILIGMAFFDALADDFKGTIYGKVSDETAAIIEREYGIR